MDDEICPYATFHLLGFREEMDPTKAMQFQTFPHPHAGTMGPSGMGTPHQAHSRAGSQSMPRQNRRYDRVGSQGSQYYTQCTYLSLHQHLIYNHSLAKAQIKSIAHHFIAFVS